MFESLSTVGSELHNEMLKMYWVLVIPYFIFLFVLEILKDENPNVKDLLRRLVISILMLYSFDWCLNSIAIIGDAVSERIDGLTSLAEVIKNMGPNYSGHDNWFNLRETIIYVFNLAAYIIAYVGFFVATTLTHFVWTILYICSPLMILMYVNRNTSNITMSLYKGLVQVVVWKILWGILGALLLKLALQPEITGMEDYLMSVVLNLCIGVSMLFIPLATKSLISDGMSSFASTLAMAPAIATAGAVKLAGSRLASKALSGTKAMGKFAASPATNLINSRFQTMKDQLKPRFEKLKEYRNRYEQIGLPKKPPPPPEPPKIPDWDTSRSLNGLQKKTQQFKNKENKNYGKK